MNKKHIIILIVVAVVIYLWWKNNHKTVKVAGDGSDGSNALDYNSTDSIIAHSGMTSADAAYVRNYVSKVESDLSHKASIEDKAIERGYTYAQMVVLDGIWSKYCRMVDGVSQFKDGITDAQKSYYWTVTNKIKNL